MKVKKYLLFAGSYYYPSGFEDYKGSFDTIEEALEAGKDEDWCCVVEHATMKRVR